MGNSATQWMFDPVIVKPALIESFKKMSPRAQWRNPVMFVVYLGSILTTALFVQALGGDGAAVADNLGISDLSEGRSTVSHREEQFGILVATDCVVAPVHLFSLLNWVCIHTIWYQ